MDCLFSQQIPKSTETCIILKPTQKTFINGLSSKYSTHYPEQLKDKIPQEKFKTAIYHINNALQNSWPCPCAFYFYGYLCSLCTLGLSLFIPYTCIRDAEASVRREIKAQNDYNLKTYGYKLKLIKKCSTSWLEITSIQQLKQIEQQNYKQKQEQQSQIEINNFQNF